MLTTHAVKVFSAEFVTMVAEPGGTKPLITNPFIGHDPETIAPTYHSHNLYCSVLNGHVHYLCFY
jgi:hypothetical protein